MVKKKMLALASATLSLFWAAVLLVSAKTEKAQFVGKWQAVDMKDGGNHILSLLAGGPTSGLLVRLYEDNTTACGVDGFRRPIRAASDTGRSSPPGYAGFASFDMYRQWLAPALTGTQHMEAARGAATGTSRFSTAWYPLS
jgi:hypothetical protein